jgi:hypothetical protein
MLYVAVDLRILRAASRIELVKAHRSHRLC